LDMKTVRPLSWQLVIVAPGSADRPVSGAVVSGAGLAGGCDAASSDGVARCADATITRPTSRS
jgi:hypothetical protein